MRNAKVLLATLVLPGLIVSGSAQAAGTRSINVGDARSAADVACMPRVGKDGQPIVTSWQKGQCTNLMTGSRTSVRTVTLEGGESGAPHGFVKGAGWLIYLFGGLALGGIIYGVTSGSDDSPGG